MTRTRSFWFLPILGGALLLGVALMSCAPDTSAPDLKEEARPTDTPAGEVAPVGPGGNPEAQIQAVTFTDTACLDCHTDQDRLAALVVEDTAWQKVMLDAEGFAADVHASINCTACHGGHPVDEMAEAHTGLVADPSEDPEASCGTCHRDITPYAVQSLHFTLAGFNEALHARSTPENHPALDTMQAQSCASCHASCGDCHVNQPTIAGGGLLAGHAFVESPPVDKTCAACHASRAGAEYYGLNEGVPGDIHLTQAQLACTDCHSGMEMHGQGEYAEDTHRYDGSPSPGCESCHEGQVGVGSGIVQHEIHGTELLPCQACHSVAYTNCTNCHVEGSVEEVPFESVAEHSLGFVLGRNPVRSADRPWRYVPVRHVPIDVNSFDTYGPDLLDNFSSRPTWTYATPHNIQRNTPQNASCATCHGNNDLFLTADKVAEAERAANADVIVEAAPPLPENWGQIMADAMEAAGQQEQQPTPASQDATPAPVEGSDASFWDSTPTAAGESSFWDTAATAEPTTAPEDAGAPPAEPTTAAGEGGSFWDNAATEPAATAVPAATAEPTPAPTEAPEPVPASSGVSFWAPPAMPTPLPNPSYWAQLP